jgi:hypothetical protein
VPSKSLAKTHIREITRDFEGTCGISIKENVLKSFFFLYLKNVPLHQSTVLTVPLVPQVYVNLCKSYFIRATNQKRENPS